MRPMTTAESGLATVDECCKEVIVRCLQALFVTAQCHHVGRGLQSALRHLQLLGITRMMRKRGLLQVCLYLPGQTWVLRRCLPGTFAWQQPLDEAFRCTQNTTNSSDGDHYRDCTWTSLPPSHPHTRSTEGHLPVHGREVPVQRQAAM